MFVFSHPELIQGRHRRSQARRKSSRHAQPRTRRDGEKENGETRKTLTEAGVAVIDSNPEFDVTHEKSMVIDDKTAFVQSLNWEIRNLTETRDYAIVTSHRHEVDEVMDCFEADWDRKKFNAGDHAHLIWCVGNGRQRIGQLIDSAKHSLWLQNERYQDPTIIEHLVRAHARGVKIHIMARPPHKLKKEKLIEGVSGLRCLMDLGVKINKLQRSNFTASCSSPTTNAPSSAPSTSPPAASTAAASSPSRSTTPTSSSASHKPSSMTGTNPDSSTSATKASSPNSKTTIPP